MDMLDSLIFGREISHSLALKKDMYEILTGWSNKKAADRFDFGAVGTRSAGSMPLPEIDNRERGWILIWTNSLRNALAQTVGDKLSTGY
jgi:hypothetical protein